MPTKKQELAVKDETAQVPMAELDFGDDAGAGYENQTQADVAIPFLNILQGLSPEVIAEDSEYKAGMMYNTVTKEGIKGSEGLTILPINAVHKFVEWVPRTQGGGYAGVYDEDDPVVLEAKANSKKFGKYKTASGNDLVETFYLYAIDVRNLGYLIIPFFSTKINVYKGWNTTCRLFDHAAHGIPRTPPMYSHLVKLTTKFEKRASGDSYNFEMEPLYPESVVDGEKRPAILNSMIGVKNKLFLEGRKFYKMIKEDKVQTKYENTTQDAETVKTKATVEDYDSAPF